MKWIILCLGALCVAGCPSISLNRVQPPHDAIATLQGVEPSASNLLSAVVWRFPKDSGNQAGSQSILRQVGNPLRVPQAEKQQPQNTPTAALIDSGHLFGKFGCQPPKKTLVTGTCPM